MQFYNNMRFPEPRISYRIENCPLQKADDMKNAFFTIENKTILRFYPVSNNEEILVTCDSKAKFEGIFSLQEKVDRQILHNQEILML